MFFNLVKSRFKIMTRDKANIFWVCLFPIILGTFFAFTIMKIDSSSAFEKIDIAIIETEEFKTDVNFKEVLEELSNENNDDRMFNLTLTNEEKAIKELSDGNITGYINNRKLVVKEESIKASIIKSFLDEFSQKENTITNILLENNGIVDIEKINTLFSETSNMKEIESEDIDFGISYMFALLAMVCLYSGLWVLRDVRDVQADQSKAAARINLSAVPKNKILLANLFTSIIFNFSMLLITFAYYVFVLKIDFGNQLPLSIITCFVGSFSSISIALLFGVAIKKDESVKIPVYMAYSMICSFLTGLMVKDMKYLINKFVPILGYLNPANLISDSLYSLYYYNNYDKYILNISILLIISVLSIIASVTILRSQKYENI